MGFPALLKKRVSKYLFEAVTGCTLGSDDAQEREDKEKRRQVSRNLARLRYVVAETLETIKAAIPTTRSLGSHSYSITLTWQNALTWLF